MSNLSPVITIDGPSGTGKGTISQLLAQSLGWHLLDSGALYRVLALAAKQHGVGAHNESALEVLAAHLDVRFDANDTFLRILLEGDEVSEEIRTEECGEFASVIAVYAGVRHALLSRQKAFRQPPGLVSEGRDMGTVVFPDALVKIYLDAEMGERVHRRYNQLKERGINVSLARVEEELQKRDTRDQQRGVSPLKPADDAIVIDSTGLTIERVTAYVMQNVREKLPDACDMG